MGTEVIALCNPYVLSVPQMLEPWLLLFTRFTLNISAIDTMKAWVPDRNPTGDAEQHPALASPFRPSRLSSACEIKELGWMTFMVLLKSHISPLL